MNYYTSTIPLPLAEKLEEKGMMVDIDCDTFDEGTQYQRDEVWCNNTYSEVFDWLMSRGVPIYIRPCYLINGDLGGWQPCYRIWKMKAESTWHEAAEKAIEKALELI